MLARLLAPLLLASAGCLTPPAVFAVPTDLEAALADYPPGTREVALDVPGGPRLSGVFVPAGEGAPVMLHLQEAGGSVARRRSGYGVLFARLRDLGVASLCFDWAGIGRSEGHRSPWNLERDSRAMWDAAVERAGGPKRVLVRGISLGTLGAAHLLESDARPAAWLLVVPVLADTAVTRYASEFHGGLTAWVASWAYRDLTDVDLVSALARATAPLVVTSSSDEVFLSAGERSGLARAVRAAGGRWRDEPGGHFLVALRARGLFAAEVETLAATLDGAPGRGSGDTTGELAARLERLAGVAPSIAEAVAARAGSDPDAEDALGTAVLEAWRLASYGAAAWPPEAIAAYLDLDDDAGPLPRAAIRELRELRDECVAARAVYLSAGARWLGAMTPRLLDGEDAHGDVAVGVAEASIGTEVSWSFAVGNAKANYVEVLWTTRPLVEAVAGLERPAAERQLLRSLLKVFRIPDRVVAGPAGPVVQAFEEGAWADVEPGGKLGSVSMHLPASL